MNAGLILACRNEISTVCRKNNMDPSAVYWLMNAANGCQEIDCIYVVTDDADIKEMTEGSGIDKVKVIDRSENCMTGMLKPETVMLELADQDYFDTVILLQPAFPMPSATDLAGGFAEFHKPDTGSVLSVVRQKRRHWQETDNGFIRLEDNELTENGSFYIISRKLLLQSQSKMAGNIRAYIMEPTAAEQNPVNGCVEQEKFREAVSNIRLFLTDCDGCLTDGGMYYSEKGDELKRFHVLDGMGFRLLQKKGILTGIVTGEKRELNRRRAGKLNLDILEQGIQDKLSVVRRICKEYQIDLQQVAYVGDDINDIEVIKAVGFGCSVPNGIPQVKESAVYITQKAGGHGAVREVIDLILKYRS